MSLKHFAGLKAVFIFLLLASGSGCATRSYDPLHKSKMPDWVMPRLDSDDRRFYRETLLGN